MKRSTLKAEAREVTQLIREIRKSGEHGKLALVLEEELVDDRSWLAQRDYENQLMQQCIFGMMEGRSPCEWCADFEECNGKLDSRPEGFMNCKGCKDWFLRFLSDEEVKECKQRAGVA